MTELCKTLDADNQDKPYTASLNEQIAKFNDVKLTPSAIVLQSMSQQQLPFFKFAMSQSKQHLDYFKSKPLSASEMQTFELASATSIKQQRQIERTDTVSFERFLQQYFSSGKVSTS